MRITYIEKLSRPDRLHHGFRPWCRSQSLEYGTEGRHNPLFTLEIPQGVSFAIGVPSGTFR